MSVAPDRLAEIDQRPLERLPRAKVQRGRPLSSDEPRTGRARARYWYEAPAVCERCSTPGPVERHHKDGNALNNSVENIAFLCRRCHMTVDGRIARTYDDECRNGHPRTDDNTYVSPAGTRTCRVCKRDARLRRESVQ